MRIIVGVPTMGKVRFIRRICVVKWEKYVRFLLNHLNTSIRQNDVRGEVLEVAVVGLAFFKVE